MWHFSIVLLFFYGCLALWLPCDLKSLSIKLHCLSVWPSVRSTPSVFVNLSLCNNPSNNWADVVQAEEEANSSPTLELAFLIATHDNQLARLKLIQNSSRDSVHPWYMLHLMVIWECWSSLIMMLDRETLLSTNECEFVFIVCACNQWGIEQTRLIPECSLLHFSVLYLCLDGNSVSSWLRWWHGHVLWWVL